MKLNFTIFVTLVLSRASCIETYSEELRMWRLSDKLSLHSFDFDFEIEETGSSNSNVLDYMPSQIYALVKEIPELVSLDVSLAQGRWNTNLVPRIQSFAANEDEIQHVLPERIQYEPSEPGFTLDLVSNGKLEQAKFDKVISVVSSLLQVAIFELRHEAITLDFGSPKPNEVWTYFAKPFESICQENFKFVLRHLDSFLFDSGVHKLINQNILHNTHYKNIRYRLHNQNGNIKLKISISYVVEERSKADSAIQSLTFPVQDIIQCANCKQSTIVLARSNTFTTVYDHNDPSFSQITPVSSLIDIQFWRDSNVKLIAAPLSSIRYLSDFSFSKDASFFHNLKNSQNTPVDVITHDYFIESLKPYLHEIQVFQRSLDTGQVKELSRKSYKTDSTYIRKEQGSSESVIKIELTILARHEVIISFGILKNLQNFEDYPNDPQRGHNVMHTPIQYRYGDLWRTIQSQALLVQTPEPDFSMPFNVNAATNALLGVFLINMYNSLVKPKRLL